MAAVGAIGVDASPTGCGTKAEGGRPLRCVLIVQNVASRVWRPCQRRSGDTRAPNVARASEVGRTEAVANAFVHVDTPVGVGPATVLLAVVKVLILLYGPRAEVPLGFSTYM